MPEEVQIVVLPLGAAVLVLIVLIILDVRKG
jgi:hypothetical protein